MGDLPAKLLIPGGTDAVLHCLGFPVLQPLVEHHLDVRVRGAPEIVRLLQILWEQKLVVKLETKNKIALTFASMTPTTRVREDLSYLTRYLKDGGPVLEEEGLLGDLLSSSEEETLDGLEGVGGFVVICPNCLHS